MPTLSREEIRSYVEDHGQISWMPASSLLRGKVISCVDGRAKVGLIGAPGGSAGEMLVGLSAAMAVGKKVEPGAVPELLYGWLAKFGRFYMHGDAIAMNKLPSWILGELKGRLDEVAAKKMEVRIHDAPVHRRPELLESLTDNAIGCGHLDLVLANPEGYRVPRRIVRSLRQAFFRALWKGEALDYPILAGEHVEGAVCSVTTGEGQLEPADEVPTFAPMVRDKQAFVVHPQAMAFLRKAQYGLLCDVLGKMPEEEWLAEAGAISSHQARNTLSELAKGLPTYEVRYFDRQAFEVLERSSIFGY